MRFHMVLLPTYFPELNPPYGQYFQEVLEQVQLAEELGWDCYWFTEHHFLLYGGPIPNPAVMLSAAAARTSKIRLGSSISIIPLHHPVQIAEDYAMVDAISQGRLEFGIGIGNTAIDYEVYGVDRETSRARFQEAAEVVKQAWSSDHFGFQGEHFTFPDAPLYPRPVQRPTPPFWVAGTSAGTLGWAGRHGYDVMTVAHAHAPEAVKEGIDAWRQGLAESGFDPSQRHIQLHVRTWVDTDAARAREVGEMAIGRYEAISAVGRRASPSAAYDWRAMWECGRNVYGTPEQCIEGIQNAQRNYQFDVLTTTFNYGGLPHADVVAAMKLFAREVMPAFQDA